VFLDRHGAEAVNLLNKFGTHWSPIELEALHAIHATACFHLTDFYFRRMPLFLSEKDHGLKYLDKISKVFKTELSWDGDRLDQERKSLEKCMRDELPWVGALM